ncbi:MAG: spermidine synthase [Gammaproteobacteria bacterium]|nr:MAG: spermidine synthase [Gammaproteobacteria bacterium]
MNKNHPSTEPQSNDWYTERFISEGSSIGLQLTQTLHKEQSAFQSIEIYETSHFGNLLVLDGCIMLTEKDNFIYHEMMAHPALFSHPSPSQVAIIGGGDCGTLKEVLKHKDVEKVVQVEIDQRVTELCQRFFPQLCESNNDPRAEFYFGDGIQWVEGTPNNSLDLLIIDSTDPVGPAEGLFSQGFYQACFEALKPGGVLVLQSESPFYHSHTIIKDMKLKLKACGFENSITRLFPQPVYPSGWWSCTASYKSAPQGSNEHAMKRAKTFATDYYNAEIHFASQAQPEFMR